MINRMSAEVESVLSDHQALLGKFSGLTSNANDALSNIQGLNIEIIDSDYLLINVLGKTIKIQFCPVCRTEGYLVGQITSLLVTNKGTLLETEKIILSSWFDDLGNVNYPTIEKNSGYNLTHNNYLKTFVFQTIQRLLSCEYMAPDSSNC